MPFDVREYLRERLIAATVHRDFLTPFALVLAACLAGSALKPGLIQTGLALATVALAFGFGLKLEAAARPILFAVAAIGYFFAFRQTQEWLPLVFLRHATTYAVPPLALHLLMTLHTQRHRLISNVRLYHVYAPMVAMMAGVLVVLLRQQRAEEELVGITTMLVPLIYWVYNGVLLFFVVLGFLSGLEAAQKAPEKETTFAGDYEQEGKFTIASHIYAKERKFDKSAEAAQKAGNWLMAAEMYRQAGDFFRAGEMYYRAQKLDEALAMYEASRTWTAAAQVSLKLGRADRAAEFYERAGDAGQAIRVLEQAGKSVSAELYVKARHFERAADAFRSQGNLQRAAEIYEMDLGQKSKAAELYLGAGFTRKAGELYEAAGQKAQAIAAYLKSPDTALHAARLSFDTGDVARARQILEKHKLEDDEAVLLLARIYWQEHKIDDAIKVLQKLTSQPEPAGAATLLLGRCFMAKGLPELAEDELRRAIAANLDPAEELEARYHMGRVLETLNKPTEAAEIYHDIIKKDFHYKDAEQRYRAIRNKSESRA